MADAIPEADLLADLRRVADRLGRSPSKRDYADLGEHSYATYHRRFGSWNAALAAAGLDIHTQHRPLDAETVAADLRRLATDMGHPPSTVDYEERGAFSRPTVRKYLGDEWADALRAAGLDPDERPEPSNPNPRVPDADLVAELRRLADDLGHPPVRQELGVDGAYSARLYTDRFGSFDAALAAAGLEDPSADPSAGGTGSTYQESER